MEDKHSKLIKILFYVLGGISILITIIFYFGIGSADVATWSLMNILLYWAYFLVIVTAAIAIIAPIFFLIKKPKDATTVVIGLLGFAVLFVVSYFLADNNNAGYEDFNISEAGSQRIGAIIILTYILGGIAVVSALLSSFIRFRK